jgi:hypothetical protein
MRSGGGAPARARGVDGVVTTPPSAMTLCGTAGE